MALPTQWTRNFSANSRRKWSDHRGLACRSPWGGRVRHDLGLKNNSNKVQLDSTSESRLSCFNIIYQARRKDATTSYNSDVILPSQDNFGGLGSGFSGPLTYRCCLRTPVSQGRREHERQTEVVPVRSAMSGQRAGFLELAGGDYGYLQWSREPWRGQKGLRT